ncbi:MAG: OsmC family protein [Leptospira sp.]|jgi:putative redox protein|nr:OsmC family protein [Leptospira sp.]
MKVTLKRIESPFVLQAENEQGNQILIDASPEIGGTNKGPRPMELLLMGLAGCTSIDVLMILQKQKLNVVDYSVDVVGEREQVDQVKLFKDIHLTFHIKGPFEIQNAKRAIDLSLEKYCSVAKTLEKTAKITYTLLEV